MSKRASDLPLEELQLQQQQQATSSHSQSTPASEHAADKATNMNTAAAVASSAAAAMTIAPLPQQRLGCKRIRISDHPFGSFAQLASVEVQLVLQLLDNGVDWQRQRRASVC